MWWQLSESHNELNLSGHSPFGVVLWKKKIFFFSSLLLYFNGDDSNNNNKFLLVLFRLILCSISVFHFNNKLNHLARSSGTSIIFSMYNYISIFNTLECLHTTQRALMVVVVVKNIQINVSIYKQKQKKKKRREFI